MNSRQRIKALKIYGIYDRRGKKYNNKPLTYYFAEGENLRQITSLWYDFRKARHSRIIFYLGDMPEDTELKKIKNIL